jgi:nitrite reductase/ring-hydroxylating ferredoxin subunit
MYAIEARSPAEGAYSEGFIKAKFTQDFGIECPSTGSVFSLKTGEILEWYPGNPVLAALTPRATCRPLSIFPIKLQQDAIYVDVSSVAARIAATRGGADTSLENNNVYGLEPKVYLEGTSPEDPFNEAGADKGPKLAASAATLAVGITAAAITLVAGAALFIYAFETGN